MYKKNEETEFFCNGNSDQILGPFINYSHNKQFSLQNSLISQQIVTHLHKQIFSLSSRICDVISFISDYFGPPAKIKNKAGHNRRIALVQGNSRVVIYTDPSSNKQDPIVVVLYGSARFASQLYKEMLAGNFIAEMSGKSCKSLSVKTSRNHNQIVQNFIRDLRKEGYQLTADDKHRNYYYLENRTWDTDYFRITVRFDPVHKEMSPGIIQIDKFVPDEGSYADLAWLLKSIQSLNISVKPHEIEFQVILPGADESIVLELLKKVTLKGIRKFGYSNGKRQIVPNYKVKTSVAELLVSTHYVGNSRSSIQIRIYKRADADPKLEFVLRDRFLSKIDYSGPGDLFNNNIWNSISDRVVFGTLDMDILRMTKNRGAFQKAQQTSKLSLHSAKQALPGNPYRYIKIDEDLKRKVCDSFLSLNELLTYVWDNVEGDNSDKEDFSTKSNPEPSTSNGPKRIFPELDTTEPTNENGEGTSASSILLDAPVALKKLGKEENEK